jgi:hypothetical protein
MLVSPETPLFLVALNAVDFLIVLLVIRHN